MGKSLMNVWTLVGLVFILSIFFTLVVKGGSFLRDQHNDGIIELPAEQQLYILGLQNEDTGNLTSTEDELRDPVAFQSNTSGAPLTDFSIEFFFAQDKSITLREKIQYLFDSPAIMLRMVGLPKTDFDWVVNSILWLLVIAVFTAIILFIRGILT